MPGVSACVRSSPHCLPGSWAPPWGSEAAIERQLGALVGCVGCGDGAAPSGWRRWRLVPAPTSALGPRQLPSDSVTTANSLVRSVWASSSIQRGRGCPGSGWAGFLDQGLPAQHRARHRAAETRLNLPRGEAVHARRLGGRSGRQKSGSFSHAKAPLPPTTSSARAPPPPVPQDEFLSTFWV